MKKKILAAILTAAMTIGMVGCGSTSSSDNGNNSASNTEASSNERPYGAGMQPLIFRLWKRQKRFIRKTIRM